jgi:hypothetical protein
MNNAEKRGPWYLITGLVIGLLVGILYSSLIAPPEFNDISPHLLNDRAKEEYRNLIAMAFVSSEDLSRAQTRLVLLKDEDPVQALSAQAQKIIANGGSEYEAQALATLAEAIRKGPSATQPPPEIDIEATEISPLSSTSMGTSEITLPLNSQSTAGQNLQDASSSDLQNSVIPGMDLPFVLEDIRQVCDLSLSPDLLQIEVKDQSGKPLAGAHINISWEKGQELFSTGIYPQIPTGFADFIMQKDTKYQIRVGEFGEIIHDLTSPVCEDEEGNSFAGGWLLSFTP